MGSGPAETEGSISIRESCPHSDVSAVPGVLSIGFCGLYVSCVQCSFLVAAMRIQISQSTKEHLDSHFPMEYSTQLRGNIGLKVQYAEKSGRKCSNCSVFRGFQDRGTMTTYWLLGRENFPYHVNLDQAEMNAQRSKFWDPNTEDAKIESVHPECV